MLPRLRLLMLRGASVRGAPCLIICWHQLLPAPFSLLLLLHTASGSSRTVRARQRSDWSARAGDREELEKPLTSSLWCLLSDESVMTLADRDDRRVSPSVDRRCAEVRSMLQHPAPPLPPSLRSAPTSESRWDSLGTTVERGKLIFFFLPSHLYKNNEIFINTVILILVFVQHLHLRHHVTMKRALLPNPPEVNWPIITHE